MVSQFRSIVPVVSIAPAPYWKLLSLLTFTLPMICILFWCKVPVHAQGTNGYPSGGSGYPTGGTTGSTTTTATTAGATTGSAAPAPPTPADLQIHVVWTKDSTVYPPLQMGSIDGKVGGQYYLQVHLSFTPPVAPNTYVTKPYIQVLKIHELLGHTADCGIGLETPVPITKALELGGTAYAFCGDADPGQQGGPPVYYFDFGWSVASEHNGSHNIAATVGYTVTTFTNGIASPPQICLIGTNITVDLENLLITSASTGYGTNNPLPILWDPNAMPSATVTASVTAAYKAYQAVALSIFDSGGRAIKTITPPPNADNHNDNTIIIGGDGPTPVSLAWDGTMDSSGSSSTVGSSITGNLFGGDILPPPPTTTPPSSSGKAPKGVYLYQLAVGCIGDYDTDKSTFLSIPQANVLWTGYDPIANQNSFTDSCVLSDTEGKPAYSAHVITYDPNLLQIAGPTTVGTITNAPGAQPLLWNDIETPQTANSWGLYTHVFDALDDHQTEDKGHRRRWALENSGLAGTVGIIPYLINKDDPTNTTWEALPGAPRVVYGGSQASTSDQLALQAVVTDLGVGSPTYTWTVTTLTGDGAAAYPPPAPASATPVWNVGSMNAVPGVLRFTCLVTWPNGFSVSQYVDIEVGIRTDDAVCIGWIDPSRVTVGQPDSEIANEFPAGGPNDPNFDRGGCAEQLAILSMPSTETTTYFNITQMQGQYGPTVDPPAITGIQMFLTQPEKDYILNWLFKYTANPDPKQVFTGDLGAYEKDPTNYKLINHFQVKYRVKDGQFNGTPITLQQEAKIGTTHNPVAGIPLMGYANPPLLGGQAGPNNDAVFIPADSSYVSHVNDGSPDARGVRSFTALEGLDSVSPIYWEDIGSKITFECKYPWTGPKFVVQPYPTYTPYTNGVVDEPFPEASTPLKNFNAHPYPFGNGGRNGDGTQSAAPDAGTPPFVQP